jgi:Tol biopolymer transport system component
MTKARFAILSLVLLVSIASGMHLCSGDEATAAAAGAPFRNKIVFFGNSSERHRLIETMNLDGSGLHTVLEMSFEQMIGHGRVSLDGRCVAFTEIIDGQKPAVWLLSADSQRPLIVDNGWLACWSPDSKRIAFTRGLEEPEKNHRESLIIDVMSRRVRALRLPGVDNVEDWSPDGTELTVSEGNPDKLFQRPDGETYPLRALYFIKPDGTRLAPLTQDPKGDFLQSRFSPDGRQIAYYHRYHYDGKTFESCVVAKRDGSKPRETVCFTTLAEGLEIRPNGGPCWSPDCKTVIWMVLTRPYGSDTTGHELIFTAADGSRTRRMPLGKERQWWGFIDCR